MADSEHPQSSEIFRWSRKLLHEIYTCIFPAVSCPASISFQEQAFSLGTEAGKVISRLKVCIVTPPILQYPDSNREFYPDTDASINGLSYVLG